MRALGSRRELRWVGNRDSAWVKLGPAAVPSTPHRKDSGLPPEPRENSADSRSASQRPTCGLPVITATGRGTGVHAPGRLEAA